LRETRKRFSASIDVVGLLTSVEPLVAEEVAVAEEDPVEIAGWFLFVAAGGGPVLVIVNSRKDPRKSEGIR
jgi:hypothetical protein